MLVLTREKHGRIILRDQRTGEVVGRITVVEIRGGKVKLGFEAPDDIKVLRDELVKTDGYVAGNGAGRS